VDRPDVSWAARYLISAVLIICGLLLLALFFSPLAMPFILEPP